jgi:succinate-acetate transporter protein
MSSSPSLAASPEKYDLQPMAHVQTMEKQYAAFGGQFQPVFYPPDQQRTLGNPLPLGLCAFALGCFVLGLIEMQVRDITTPNILVGLAFGYGGLVQVCSGMWYVFDYSYSFVSQGRGKLTRSRAIACGNTFGATVMASYGGFWLSTGIIFTPGGFNIMSTLIEADSGRQGMFYDSFGIFLMVCKPPITSSIR